MAWEAVSKEEVAKISGTTALQMQDEWYDWAVALIGIHANIYNIGTLAPTTVTEVRDGNNTRRLFVNKPPISAVTSVAIDGTTISSDFYTFDTSCIVFTDNLPTNPHIATLKFVPGAKNITVVYTSGVTTDDAVSTTIALVIKEFSKVERLEGAEAHLQFFQVGKNRATEAPLTEWGMHGKIVGIIRSFLGRKFKVA